MALSWSRPKLSGTVTKAPVINAALTDGDTAVIDLFVDDSDSDFAADTIMVRLKIQKTIVGSELQLKLTPLKWTDGTTAYTDFDTPADTDADEVGDTVTIATVNLDAFWAAAGFARTNS